MVGTAAVRVTTAIQVMSASFDADRRIFTPGIFLILLLVVRAPAARYRLRDGRKWRMAASYGADRPVVRPRLVIRSCQNPLVLGFDARFIHACSASVGACRGAA